MGMKLPQEFEEAGGVKEFEVVIGGGTLLVHGADHDDRQFRRELLDGKDDIVRLHIADDVVEDDSIDSGKAFDGLNGLFSGVRRDDVELGGLNDQLARGDVAGEFAVNDDEAGSGHFCWMNGKQWGWSVRLKVPGLFAVVRGTPCV